MLIPGCANSENQFTGFCECRFLIIIAETILQACAVSNRLDSLKRPMASRRYWSIIYRIFLILGGYLRTGYLTFRLKLDWQGLCSVVLVVVMIFISVSVSTKWSFKSFFLFTPYNSYEQNVSK